MPANDQPSDGQHADPVHKQYGQRRAGLYHFNYHRARVGRSRTWTIRLYHGIPDAVDHAGGFRHGVADYAGHCPITRYGTADAENRHARPDPDCGIATHSGVVSNASFATFATGDSRIGDLCAAHHTRSVVWTVHTALFRAFQKMWPILIVNVGGLALQLALTWFAIQAGIGLVGVATALIAVNILQLMATWRFWRALNPLAQTDCPSPPIREVLRRAWPFALAAVLNALQLRLNVLLLEHVSGDVSVGIYSAASRFVEAARLVPGAFFGALFPMLASLVAMPSAMRQTFLRAFGLLLIFSVTFAIAMTLIGGLLLRLTYDPRGTSFAEATPVLTLLAWALVPSLISDLLTLYLYSLGQEHFVNAVTFVVLAAQAVIGWLLVSQWGAQGAAISVGIVEGGSAAWLGVRALRSR